jgi:hypothetical protein
MAEACEETPIIAESSFWAYEFRVAAASSTDRCDIILASILSSKTAWIIGSSEVIQQTQ